MLFGALSKQTLSRSNFDILQQLYGCFGLTHLLVLLLEITLQTLIINCGARRKHLLVEPALSSVLLDFIVDSVLFWLLFDLDKSEYV